MAKITASILRPLTHPRLQNVLRAPPKSRSLCSLAAIPPSPCRARLMRRTATTASRQRPSTGLPTSSRPTANTRLDASQSNLDRRVAERAAQPVHDELAVAVGEHALEIGGVDLDVGESWSAGHILHGLRKRLDLAKRRDRLAVADAAGA